MSTPLQGDSAMAGIQIDGIEATMKVTVPDTGIVRCALACNGRNAIITFNIATGDVDTDVPSS